MKTIKEMELDINETPDLNPMKYGYSLALKDVLGLIDEGCNKELEGNLYCGCGSHHGVILCNRCKELKKRING